MKIRRINVHSTEIKLVFLKIIFYHCKGDPESRVHGFIHDDIFEGRIFCGDGNEYNIDSIIQYKHLNHSADVHSVIYNAADIIPPKRHVCGGARAETRNWMTSQTNQTNLNKQGTFIYLLRFQAPLIFCASLKNVSRML